MARKIYLVMNEMGVESVYGVREKADARCTYLSEKYALKHWVDTKEITVD